MVLVGCFYLLIMNGNDCYDWHSEVTGSRLKLFYFTLFFANFKDLSHYGWNIIILIIDHKWNVVFKQLFPIFY